MRGVAGTRAAPRNASTPLATNDVAAAPRRKNAVAMDAAPLGAARGGCGGCNADADTDAVAAVVARAWLA